MKYATFILGQPSLDVNTDFGGAVIREVGGAVIQSAYAAASLGHQVAVLPKCADDIDAKSAFAGAENITVFPLRSATSTSISNVYHTADRERRTCRAISRVEPYKAEEIPKVDAPIWHIAGLMYGDFDETIIRYAAQNAKAAVDVQCLLRRDEGGEMVFRDWPCKKEILPLISFLKTDAAEAEILTGMSDRVAAAKQLHAWGAKEIMITHHNEVLIYDGAEIYTKPLKARNLTGRTGRGDNCFSAYITERLTCEIPQALLSAAALTSLKMETPGPFKGTRADVEAYIKDFY